MENKTIIIGVDGGTFDLIDIFIEEGHLPFFKKMKENGVWARMRSVDQTSRVPISPTIWTSLATGKRPEKHSITSFFNLQSDITSARLFEIFNNFGYKFGSMGWELTWPPEDYGAFTIPDTMARDDSTLPAKVSVIQQMRRSAKKGRTSLFENISFFFRLKNAGVSNTTLLSLISHTLNTPNDRREKMFKRLILGNRVNEDVYFSLMKEYDPQISFFFIPITDTAGHYYWKYFDKKLYPDIPESEKEKYGGYLLEVYRETDRILSRCASEYSDADIFVVSDHGMRAISDGSFETLSLKSGAFLEASMLKDKVDFFHVGLNIVVVAKPGGGIDENALFSFLKSMQIEPIGKSLFELVEKDETGRIFIKVRQTDKGEYEGLSYENLTIRIGMKKAAFKDIIEINDIERFADHDEWGIFLAMGRGIKRGVKLEDCTIYDFLPTLLSSKGLPISRDFDGKDLRINIEAGEPKYTDSYDFLVKKREKRESTDDEAVKEELRRLGYLKDK